MKGHFRRGRRGRPLTKELPTFPILFLATVLFVAGCSRTAPPPSSVTVTDKQVTPLPARVGSVTISFSLNDAGKPVSGAQVSLEGDMTHAGMAPVFGDAHEASPGHYRGRLTLNMSGDWVVLMHLTLPDGHNMDEQMVIRGVQSK